jgi:hypothetical protein
MAYLESQMGYLSRRRRLLLAAFITLSRFEATAVSNTNRAHKEEQ